MHRSWPTHGPWQESRTLYYNKSRELLIHPVHDKDQCLILSLPVSSVHWTSFSVRTIHFGSPKFWSSRSKSRTRQLVKFIYLFSTLTAVFKEEHCRRKLGCPVLLYCRQRMQSSREMIISASCVIGYDVTYFSWWILWLFIVWSRTLFFTISF